MRYFFLAYLLLAVFIVSAGGFRGLKFSKPPIEVFSDMDRQDKLKGQRPSQFFRDGQGARLPVAGTVPHSSDDGVFPVEFGEGGTSYYYTGKSGAAFGTGLPEELGLTAENMVEFAKRGEEMYGIYCAVCHGASGNGKGVVSNYTSVTITDLHSRPRAEYPDGELYEVITKGRGLMSGYGANIPVRDRWAIVAYVRVLQGAKDLDPAELNQESNSQ